MTGVGICLGQHPVHAVRDSRGRAAAASKTGVYMGIFNFFIVLPEIIASLRFGWIMRHFLNNNHLTVVLLGGACLILAAILMRQVPKEEPVAA